MQDNLIFLADNHVFVIMVVQDKFISVTVPKEIINGLTYFSNVGIKFLVLFLLDV